MKIFLYSSFVFSCHLFLISFASVSSILFLSFIEPISAWNVPLVSLIFLKRSLAFPILLVFSLSLYWSLRKAFVSLLAVLWKSAFKWVYLSFSPLLVASLLFSVIYKASSDSCFTFLHFFFLGMVVPCLLHNVTNLCPLFFRPSIRSNPLTLSLPPYNCMGMLDPTKKRYPRSKGKGEAPARW